MSADDSDEHAVQTPFPVRCLFILLYAGFPKSVSTSRSPASYNPSFEASLLRLNILSAATALFGSGLSNGCRSLIGDHAGSGAGCAMKRRPRGAWWRHGGRAGRPSPPLSSGGSRSVTYSHGRSSALGGRRGITVRFSAAGDTQLQVRIEQ